MRTNDAKEPTNATPADRAGLVSRIGIPIATGVLSAVISALVITFIVRPFEPGPEVNLAVVDGFDALKPRDSSPFRHSIIVNNTGDEPLTNVQVRLDMFGLVEFWGDPNGEQTAQDIISFDAVQSQPRALADEATVEWLRGSTFELKIDRLLPGESVLILFDAADQLFMDVSIRSDQVSVNRETTFDNDL